MKKKFYISTSLFCLSILIFLIFNKTISGNSKSENNKFYHSLIPDSLFHSGDIIFRDGRGIISNAFRQLSRDDPRYSHAGIIHRENGNIFVYHVIGGEENKSCRMKKDLLKDFCSSIRSNSFAVYRTDQNAGEIDSLAGNYYSKKLLFDYKFDLKTDDKMYCTELIYKILAKVSSNDNFLPLTTISGTEYISCDNIYLSPHATKIYSIDYTFGNDNEK